MHIVAYSSSIGDTPTLSLHRGWPKHNHNQEIFQKSFASDATPKRHLMAHQMKNLCGFSVFHCVEGAFGASSMGTRKLQNGVLRDELKNGCGCVWAVPYCNAPCSRVAPVRFGYRSRMERFERFRFSVSAFRLGSKPIFGKGMRRSTFQ